MYCSYVHVCNWQEGEIVCDDILKTCPKPKCGNNKLIWDKKQCCPTCPPSKQVPLTWCSLSLYDTNVGTNRILVSQGTHPSSLQSVKYTISILGQTCKEHGITYQDGDTWNPYYPRFGVLDCFMCTCKVIYKLLFVSAVHGKHRS